MQELKSQILSLSLQAERNGDRLLAYRLEEIAERIDDMFEIIREEIESASIRSIVNKETPDEVEYPDMGKKDHPMAGKKYLPVSRFTVEHRISGRDGGYILRDTDDMLNSISINIDENGQVVVKSSDTDSGWDKAELHSKERWTMVYGQGSPVRIPARPMVGIDKTGVMKLVSRLNKLFEGIR